VSAERVRALRAAAYRIPTEAPESDGTHCWDSTTMIVVEADAGGQTGIGYTYSDASAAAIVRDRFAPLVEGRRAMDVGAAWDVMVADLRNAGRPGIGACAVSAVDGALWDLKAKLLGLPLADLLGRVRDSVAAYGSGGFTSLDESELSEQLGGWAASGFAMVKMKVGREPARDPGRVAAARRAIGDSCALMVDANGAYSRRQAVAAADVFAESAVIWFEEPVSSDDRDGLGFVRRHAPSGMAVAAGEYGYDPWYYADMLRSDGIDVLQADATRCLGITGWLNVAALCEAGHVPLSAHCAPSAHLHVASAARPLIHVEYFADHVRIESMLFDGFPEAREGRLRAAGDRCGHGIALRRPDAERWRVA
jgi:L-alanine-DL-glutamate epimerase-like enolase superfamily enzyme